MDIVVYVFVDIECCLWLKNLELGSEFYVFVDALRVVYDRVEALYYLVVIDFVERLMVSRFFFCDV